MAGDDSYFLLSLPGGGLLLCKDRCEHRGGPLHLGHWDDAKNCLVCPWHQSKYSEKVLRRRATPLINRRGLVTAVLDAAPSARVRLTKKTILPPPSQ